MRAEIQADAILVDGMILPPERIQAEMQYHPADEAADAWREAAMALVLKVLLHRRARDLSLAPEGDPLDPALPTDWLDALIDAEITLPEATEAEYRRFHDRHPELFEEPMEAEAQHILLAAPPEDIQARATAKSLAAELIAEIAADPGKFEPLAGKYSSCPSAPMGGHLGKVARGSAVPEFETYLFNLDEGALCPIPIESRYGVHVLRVLKRFPARPLTYDEACKEVAQVFGARARTGAVKSFLNRLVAQSRIEGLQTELSC